MMNPPASPAATEAAESRLGDAGGFIGYPAAAMGGGGMVQGAAAAYSFPCDERFLRWFDACLSLDDRYILSLQIQFFITNWLTMLRFILVPETELVHTILIIEDKAVA